MDFKIVTEPGGEINCYYSVKGLDWRATRTSEGYLCCAPANHDYSYLSRPDSKKIERLAKSRYRAICYQLGWQSREKANAERLLSILLDDEVVEAYQLTPRQLKAIALKVERLRDTLLSKKAAALSSIMLSVANDYPVEVPSVDSLDYVQEKYIESPPLSKRNPWGV